MGIRAYIPTPITGEEIELKASGMISHAIWTRVPEVRDPEYPDCIYAVFTLTPEQCGDVADRMFEELIRVDMDSFTHMQEVYANRHYWKAAFLLKDCAMKGLSTHWG